MDNRAATVVGGFQAGNRSLAIVLLRPRVRAITARGSSVYSVLRFSRWRLGHWQHLEWPVFPKLPVHVGISAYASWHSQTSAHRRSWTKQLCTFLPTLEGSTCLLHAELHCRFEFGRLPILIAAELTQRIHVEARRRAGSAQDEHGGPILMNMAILCDFLVFDRYPLPGLTCYKRGSLMGWSSLPRPSLCSFWRGLWHIL